tara:strand:+ start:8268 stop:8717 length:450 start_codon:yes stop_codon:yes gene_type:complete
MLNATSEHIAIVVCSSVLLIVIILNIERNKMKKIDSGLPVLDVLQKCNVVDGEKIVILASDWTISAIGSRMKREVLAEYLDEFVVWTQYLQFDRNADEDYKTYMDSGKYSRDYESGLKCFQRHIKNYDIKLYDCVEVNLSYRRNDLKID